MSFGLFTFTPIMKKIGLIILALAIGTSGYFAYKIGNKETQFVEAMSIIPNDAIYILESSNPIENWNTFSTSTLWTFLKTHPTLAEITEEANYLDSVINDNRTILKLLDNRQFHMSAHMISKKDYDFLFLIDLQNASKLELIPLLLKTITSKTDFELTEEEYKRVKVVALKDLKNGDELFISQIKNHLAISYSGILVLNAIEKSASENIAVAAKFAEVEKRTDNNGLARLYLNYTYLDEYIKLYADIETDLLESLSSSFCYTGLDMELDDNFAILEGHTSLPDSVEQFSLLLQKYGNAEFEFDQVISARTAYLQAIGINKFKEFYQQVLLLRSKESVKEYEALKNKIETVLGLSLEKDVLSWIGNEIILAQNVPNYLHRNEDDLLVAIKAYNVDFAREKLQLVQKAIKRRTPAKFKKLKYKAYDIYYLDIKVFFNVFFGKAFRKITKPYYTIVGEYILFSNNPKSLVSALEDYENGYVLAKSESFLQVKDKMPNRSTLFTYINGPQTYPVLSPKITTQERAHYNLNQPYIEFLKGIGLSYRSNGDGFDNTMYINFEEKQADSIPTSHAEDLAEEYLEDYTHTLKNMSESETFVLNEVNDGDFIKYFEGIDHIHLRAGTRDGVFHGSFEEYYENGTKRSEGKYRKGRKVGRWKYYNINGELTEKTWEGI